MKTLGFALLAGGALLIASRRTSASKPGTVEHYPQELTAEGLPALVVEIAESRLGQKDGSGYLAALGLPSGLNWCAAGLTAWLWEAAAHMGVRPPVPGSAGSKELMHQFQQAGRWIPRDLLSPEEAGPGLVAVWHRGEPGAITGHTGVVSRVLGHETFETIDANSTGGAVAKNVRRFDDPNLLGFGYLGEMS